PGRCARVDHTALLARARPVAGACTAARRRTMSGRNEARRSRSADVRGRACPSAAAALALRGELDHHIAARDARAARQAHPGQEVHVAQVLELLVRVRAQELLAREHADTAQAARALADARGLDADLAATAHVEEALAVLALDHRARRH